MVNCELISLSFQEHIYVYSSQQLRTTNQNKTRTNCSDTRPCFFFIHLIDWYGTYIWYHIKMNQHLWGIVPASWSMQWRIKAALSLLASVTNKVASEVMPTHWPVAAGLVRCTHESLPTMVSLFQTHKHTEACRAFSISHSANTQFPSYLTERSSTGGAQKFAEQEQNEVLQMVYKLASGGTWWWRRLQYRSVPLKLLQPVWMEMFS